MRGLSAACCVYCNVSVLKRFGSMTKEGHLHYHHARLHQGNLSLVRAVPFFAALDLQHGSGHHVARLYDGTHRGLAEEPTACPMVYR